MNTAWKIFSNEFCYSNQVDFIIDLLLFCIINNLLFLPCSGQDNEATAMLKICLPSKSRPVLNKCCQIGAILEDGGACLNTREKAWDPSFMDPTTLKPLSVESVNPVYRSPKLGCTSQELEVWPNDDCDHE